MWFHQDFNEDYGDFRSGLELFLESLSSARRSALAAELRAFLDVNSTASSSRLEKLWFGLGAYGIDDQQDIRDTLEEVYRRLQDV